MKLIFKKTDKIITMEFVLMTSNIRFENPNDGLNNWPNRKDIWSALINNHKGHKNLIHLQFLA